MTIDPDQILQYSEATIEFFMVLSADHLTGATGKTPSVTLNKDGSGFSAAAGIITEYGYGWYSIKLAVIDSSIPGTLIFHITAADCDPVDFAKEVVTEPIITTSDIITDLDISYVSVNSADSYFDTRLDSSIWTEENAENKEKALITATRYIDRLNFAGDKADDSQILEFPRDDDTEVPDEVKYACCEIAIALLDGANVEFESEMGNLESVSFGPGALRHESEWIPEHTIHGIPSIVAWRLLKPFLRDGKSFTLKRVS